MPAAQALTPESPEVRKLIRRGLEYLEKNTDDRLGGKCLIALAFIKDGAAPDHPRVQEALQACQNTTAEDMLRTDYVYGNGLAIIFLAELDPAKHRELIGRFAGVMANRQKVHGGWGYNKGQLGDTSQTQYAALCYWELMRAGITPNVRAVERCTNWLLRTQDPGGAWGYEGKDPGNFELEEQDETSISMLAAGLGSTIICGKILGLIGSETEGESSKESQEDLPAALRRSDQHKTKKMRTLSGNGVDRERLLAAIERGERWMDKNFQIEWHRFPCYYLYSLERYKSFAELISGDITEEPEWYQQGVELLAASQQEHGGWNSSHLVKAPCATAFSVLFLLRSTQKSIKASLGQGTLVGGRGLSSNLANMKIRNGKLVAVRQEKTEVDQLLGMLEESNSEELDSLLSDPTVFDGQEVSTDQSRRLRQIVRSGSPQSRLLAISVLARMRQLDEVPTLLYAMTDPDHRVVRTARDGLRFVSRRIEGFGLRDNFTDTQRYNALDQWKQWYRTIRPDAPEIVK